jgi:hypothetical protein
VEILLIDRLSPAVKITRLDIGQADWKHASFWLVVDGES